MQAVIAEQSYASPKVIFFPTRMAAPQAPNPPEQPREQGRTRHDHIIHGSKAAIAAAVFAGLAMIATFATAYVNWSNRSDQKTQQARDQADAHTSGLIDSKLNPVSKAVNDHIDQKVGELSGQIHALDVRIARLEGPLTRRVSKLETRANQEASLARLIDPNRVLATIRAEIQMADTDRRILPVSTITDYKNAIQTLPTSAREYWTTAAAIINYQSLIDQMSGQAPDPNKVSVRCAGLTNQEDVHSGNNLFIGVPISKCVVDLDTNKFSGTVFRDSVIRYHGGPVYLNGVSFVNCRFVVSLPQPTKAPDSTAQKFLRVLLESPNQTDIKVSTHS